MKHNKEYYKSNEINFEVNLSVGEVLLIANKYLKKNNLNGKIVSDDSNILYNKNDDVLHEPSWSLIVGVSSEYSGMLDMDYDLVISDKEGVVKYIVTNHGRIKYV